jgi:hypothetical protein
MRKVKALCEELGAALLSKALSDITVNILWPKLRPNVLRIKRKSQLRKTR